MKAKVGDEFRIVEVRKADGVLVCRRPNEEIVLMKEHVEEPADRPFFSNPPMPRRTV
jgi:hypothetical protein